MHVLDDESTFFSGGRDQRFLVWKIENQNDNGIKFVISFSTVNGWPFPRHSNKNKFYYSLFQELNRDGLIVAIGSRYFL